jgi:hypothetical protein
MDAPYSYETLSPLLDTLFAILKRHPEGLTEYELMQALEKEPLFRPWNARREANSRGGEAGWSDLDLFRSHFFLFHLLYRLRDLLIEERHYILSIFCLEIRLHPFQEADVQRGSSPLPAEADPMRSYYLDLSNMEGMDEEAVRELIDGFFHRFEAYYRAEEDLSILGLPEDTDFSVIRQRYRTLAFECHPDHGGDAEQFTRLHEAMDRLSKLYGG